MSRSIIVSTLVVGVLGTFALAVAQTGGHGSHDATISTSPAHRRMEAALAERDAVIARGLGAGLGRRGPNNDSGPRHVTEVRLVHLLAHIQPRAVLREEQRRLYHEARWTVDRPGDTGTSARGVLLSQSIV